MSRPPKLSHTQSASGRTVPSYHQLYRWLTMLLVSADQRAGRSVTGMNAIIRGRFMELLGIVHIETVHDTYADALAWAEKPVGT